MREKDRLGELQAQVKELEQATLAQAKLLAALPEGELETRSLKEKLKEKLTSDFKEIEVLKSEILGVETKNEWKPKSATETKKLLNDIAQSSKFDKLLIVGFFSEQVKLAKIIIELKNKDRKEFFNKIESINFIGDYDYYIKKGLELLQNIKENKEKQIKDNKIKSELMRTWKEKGISCLPEEQFTRSIVLWAASKKYKNIDTEFFKYIPTEQLKNPLVFRNLIKANFSQKDKIVTYIPKNYTYNQRELINTVIKEVEMLFDIISIGEDKKKITLNVKEKSSDTIFVTPYQYGRIKKEIGDRYKIIDIYGHEYRLKVKKT